MTFNLNFLFDPIITWLNHQRPIADVPLSHFGKIRESLKPCDVILIEGRSRVSEVIKLITQSPWSHAALYIGRLEDIKDPRVRQVVLQQYQGPQDAQLMIESQLGIGTVVRPVHIYEHEHIRICRPKGLLEQDAQDVIRYALSRLGSEYDVRQILDLARFLFPWTIMPRRWRSSLFVTNAGGVTKTVCSTLIAESFAFVQFPILPLVRRDENNQVLLYQSNPKLTVPSLFDYSPYFEIIKYPYIDYSHKESYHLLPWKGSIEHGYADIESYTRVEKKKATKKVKQDKDAMQDPPTPLH